MISVFVISSFAHSLAFQYLIVLYSQYPSLQPQQMKETTILLCDKCKKNEVEIFNDNGNCCISCWYDMTDPKIS